MSAWAMAILACSTTFFSISLVWSTSNPPVSTTRIIFPRQIQSASKRSRVVPGTLETSDFCSSTSLLNREDLPTLVRPIRTAFGAFCIWGGTRDLGTDRIRAYRRTKFVESWPKITKKSMLPVLVRSSAAGITGSIWSGITVPVAK